MTVLDRASPVETEVVMRLCLMLIVMLFMLTGCAAGEGGAVSSFLCVLLLFAGLFFSFRTRFIQIRGIKRIFMPREKKSTEQKKNAGKGPSQFQTLTTALAATAGTGNIAGVAGAVVLGGPGAVFWMWVSSLLGMATKFAETALAVRYREKNARGEWVGGPMYYIKNGLSTRWRPLAYVFCAAGAAAALGVGNAVQVNAAASAAVLAAGEIMQTPLSGSGEALLRVLLGLIVAGVTGAVIVGGASRIGRVTELVIPFISVFYIAGAVIVLCINADAVGGALGSIFREAFTPRAAMGGAGGFAISAAMRLGVGRGVFSNEAGMGSSPMAYASAESSDAVKLGMLGVIEVFADTIVMCTLTALAILVSGAAIPWGDASAADSATAISAFSTVFGAKSASIFLTVSLIIFALSTLLAWSMYGERCCGFLFNGKGISIYRGLFLAAAVYGALADVSFIWAAADMLNGLMALPNIAALIPLSGEVVRIIRNDGGLYRKAQSGQKYCRIFKH